MGDAPRSSTMQATSLIRPSRISRSYAARAALSPILVEHLLELRLLAQGNWPYFNEVLQSSSASCSWPVFMYA